MKLRSLLLLTMTGSMLLFQNCQKEKANVIPVVTEEPDTHDHEHWNYEHPNTWGGYSMDCEGVIQSPINIDREKTLKASLPDLFQYYTEFPITINDNGHTLQVTTNPDVKNNYTVFNSTHYNFKQFHFHAMSEHTIDGVHSPMEMHLVHQSDAGEILVIGLMIEEGPIDNPLVATTFGNWPNEKEFDFAKSDVVNINDVLPKGTEYYNYIGSLTTPPCSMGLQWIVMKETLKLSAEQIAGFRARYSNNYRPIQSLNNRVVYEKI